MASSVVISFLVTLLVSLYAAGLAQHPPATGGASSCYARLFSFGDSLTDAGNYVTLVPNISALAPPYGGTFFRRPTGRFCDGRLIVDFIAEALRLPLLPPYLRGKTADDFRYGANLAVAGATALSPEFFKEKGLGPTILPPYSLDLQLEWFNVVLHLLGSTEQERKDVVANSLFLMGEFGVNDYNFFLFQNRSFTAEIESLVPRVIEKIQNAVEVLIELGAKTIVVPGSIPMGCIPGYLTMFQSSNPEDYDEVGCINWLNDFAEHHNRALRSMLKQIPCDPMVTIIYADYYGAILEITRNPLKHGFSKDGALIACCGDGGRYNSNSLMSCNATSVLCPDPSRRISWDGLHYTEAAYHLVARGVLDGPYAAPSILSKCRC
ncbi:hypothetical protein ACP70R_048886 [Stipagrostis hirtigluma subsp. patula]